VAACSQPSSSKRTCLIGEKKPRTLIGLQARQNVSIEKAKEIVASGKFGKILGTTMYGHVSCSAPLMIAYLADSCLFKGAIMVPTVQESFLYGMAIETGANLVTISFGHPYKCPMLRFG
jgi:hypothetical protein